MSPPSYCSKISTRSGDHEQEIEESSSAESSHDDESNKKKVKYNGVGIVKSFLGPSIEDAVLKTFEFGKSLIQKVDDNEQYLNKQKKNKSKKSNRDDRSTKTSVNKQIFTSPIQNNERLLKQSLKKITDTRCTRKRIVFTAKLDKDMPLFNPPAQYNQKLSSVTKIRSLDSDLKRMCQSPEKIKRQLEALIQINKDEPPEHAINQFYLPKDPKYYSEVTVMPSLCLSKDEADVEPCTSGEIRASKKSSECIQTSKSKFWPNTDQSNRRKNAVQSSIRQAPEFLTSALGPTLDISIIENLKMMRNLFKCESGKGEGMVPTKTPRAKEYNPEPLKQSEEEMECRIQVLKIKIEELQEREKFLIKQIEEEERERELKRKAFEEEEKKLLNMKACLEVMAEEEKKKEFERKGSDFEMKYSALKQKIACEEEKLSRLKDQYEFYKKDIYEAKSRKEALKRNRSLLDAWDVIASRACHTRLPSFSRAYDLERKQLKGDENLGSLHCCFLAPANSKTKLALSGKKSKSKTLCGSSISINLDLFSKKSKEEIKQASHTNFTEKKKIETAFPIQRDLTCGLHKSLKSCSCSNPNFSKTEISKSNYNTDDEVIKKLALTKKKSISRSKSETTIKKDPCAKIVKVLWAITRINVFQDNCRTYEVMDATCTPPSYPPVKTEGIFVVKNQNVKKASLPKPSSLSSSRPPTLPPPSSHVPPPPPLPPSSVIPPSALPSSNPSQQHKRRCGHH